MRISGIEQFLGGADNVKAIDMIRGEQRNFQGTITATGTQTPLDITNYVISANVEFYNATATITGRGANLTASITNWMAANPAVDDDTLTVTKDSDPTTGRFTVTIPLAFAV